ncbi:MAG: hypothetical protein QF616_06185 [Candidatus Marinimicrobia bacterium]|jgi:hypothetical protein|nr:hypothetical protein [Candidatus Neomarinimicrobiota bacterium]|tara:strand:+ start:2646 stop:2870 length:225 start_codon:yes stop_codon:yes gene_type:complete
MATKNFHTVSDEHGGVNVGTKFKMIKDHQQVQGVLSEGVEVILDNIVHYPTRYRLKDDKARIWTVPIHSVIPIP